MRKTTFVLLTGAGCLAALIGRPAASAAGQKMDEAALQSARQAFVGQWKLNEQRSDDPRAKMREAREQGGGRGGWGGGRGGWGGGGGRGGWGGGRGGWGGGRGGSDDADANRPFMAPMVFTATQMSVTNLSPEITIVGQDGEIRRLHPDDKGYKDDDDAEVKTHWDQGKLVVETKTRRGSRMKETWSVGGDPRELTVMVDVERSFGGNVKVKRVYDPMPAATPPNPPPVKPDGAAR